MSGHGRLELDQHHVVKRSDFLSGWTEREPVILLQEECPEYMWIVENMEVLRSILKYTFGKLNGRTFFRLQVRIIYNKKVGELTDYASKQ